MLFKISSLYSATTSFCPKACCESIRRGKFCKISVLGVKVSWKIVCVVTKFWENFPGEFDLFLQYYFLLENCMFFAQFWENSPWKFAVLMIYFFLLENRMCSSEKFVCVLVPFLVILESVLSKPLGKSAFFLKSL